MKKESNVYLLHIVEAIDAIASNIKNINEKQFYADEVLRGFVERKLEIIGEATKRLPDGLKKQYPTIPWADMAGMRDVLIHDYEEIDTGIVWDTITQHLLPVKNELLPLLTKYSLEEKQ